MSRTQTEYLYTVNFTGDYITLFTSVQASNDEEAIRYAKKQLLHHHGIDIDNIGVWGIKIEKDGEFL